MPSSTPRDRDTGTNEAGPAGVDGGLTDFMWDPSTNSYVWEFRRSEHAGLTAAPEEQRMGESCKGRAASEADGNNLPVNERSDQEEPTKEQLGTPTEGPVDKVGDGSRDTKGSADGNTNGGGSDGVHGNGDQAQSVFTDQRRPGEEEGRADRGPRSTG